MAATPILYVEDDEDVRETLKLLLEHEGYAVTAVATAEVAIEELSRSKYALMLTDYQLPDRNADWLITTATERGLLRQTPAIVLSGAHDPHGVDGQPFLRKPVSQEALLAAFDDALSERTPAPEMPVAVSAAGAELSLALYVSGTSPSSRKALRNLTQVLRNVEPHRVAVTVHDISESDHPWVEAAEDDRVVVIPTLVRHAPLPRVWIAGDLSEIDTV